MQKWEYYITPLPVHTPGVVLNNLGGKGWELVQITQHEQGAAVAYLKRPINDDQEASQE